MDIKKALESARKEWSRYLKEGGIHRRRAFTLYHRSLNQARESENWSSYARTLKEFSAVLLSYDSPEKIYQAKRMLEEGTAVLYEKGLMREALTVQIAVFPVLLLLAELEPLKNTTILKDGLATVNNLQEMPEIQDGDRPWLKFYEGRFYEEIAHWDRERRLSFRKKAQSCFLEVEQWSEIDLVRLAKFRRALMLIEDKEYDSAEALLRECLSLAEKSGSERDFGEISQLLADVCEKRGDFRSANQFLKQAIYCWQKFGRIASRRRIGLNL
ncbi:MAG: tetratricopeptide repeat protein [bacterium]